MALALLAIVFCILADLNSVAPDHPSYDPERALSFAERAVELNAGERSLSWQSLGWARYRARDWKGCLEAFVPTKYYDSDGDFFAAMSHWHLGNEVMAYEVFTKQDRWLTDYELKWKPGVYPDPQLLRRIRAEATALLGVKNAQPPVQPRPS